MTEINEEWLKANTQSLRSFDRVLGYIGQSRGPFGLGETWIVVTKEDGVEQVELTLFHEYCTDEQGENYEEIQVHFENSQVKTAEDLLELCRLLGVKNDD